MVPAKKSPPNNHTLDINTIPHTTCRSPLSQYYKLPITTKQQIRNHQRSYQISNNIYENFKQIVNSLFQYCPTTFLYCKFVRLCLLKLILCFHKHISKLKFLIYKLYLLFLCTPNV